MASNPGNGSFDLALFLTMNPLTGPTDESFGIPTGVFRPPRLTTYDMSGLAWPRIIFRLTPIAASPRAIPPWAAKMAVRCENLQQLLLDGFTWDKDNIINAESSVRYDLAAQWIDRGFRNITTWILADRPGPGGGSPRWFARIEVITANFHDLCAFQVRHLSWRNICGATAYTAPGGMAVYHYDRHAPAESFNVLTGGLKPPSSAWPWPGKHPPSPTKPQTAAASCPPAAAYKTPSTGPRRRLWPLSRKRPCSLSYPEAPPLAKVLRPSGLVSAPVATDDGMPLVSAAFAAVDLPGAAPTPVAVAAAGGRQQLPPAPPPPKREASPAESPRPEKRARHSPDWQDRAVERWNTRWTRWGSRALTGLVRLPGWMRRLPGLGRWGVMGWVGRVRWDRGQRGLGGG